MRVPGKRSEQVSGVSGLLRPSALPMSLLDESVTSLHLTSF